ncbi:MAG TPA: FGGY family carbohydrate kinase [Kofleriaceae bacterium]|nr:FGGY family carbohydrate kinase [Kofleriaceae bacterium]
MVGVDIGTQSLKVVVADGALAVRGQAARAYPFDLPRPGWAQQDVALWEAALAPAVAEALARAGVAPAAVEAVGVAGQLDGCVAVDGGGEPLGPCLIWLDRRAEREMPELPADFRRRTGLVADPGHMAAKIRWLKRNAMGLAGARFHQPVSYLVERLTGRAVLDHGLASTTMLYGLARRAWEADLLAAFEIDPSSLPDIDSAAARAGVLNAAGAAMTGLPAGVPVAVGTGDDFATPLGAGIVAPGEVACVLGTAEVVGGLCERPVIDPGGLVETHGYATAGYFVENPGWLSGGAVAWLRGLLGAASDAELDGWAAPVAPGADGVTFLPALSGAMAPEWHAGARGCFYGLSGAHGRGHLARALLEGCAFAMRDVIDRLDELGVPTGSVVLIGGGSKSRVWSQIRADLLGRPVAVSQVPDACPLGAALLAAAAAGAIPDLAAAADRAEAARRTVDPDLGRRAAYDDAYRRYRDLFTALRPLFR